MLIRQKAPLGRVLGGHSPRMPHGCASAGTREQPIIPASIKKKRILPPLRQFRENFPLPAQLEGMRIPSGKIKKASEPFNRRPA